MVFHSDGLVLKGSKDCLSSCIQHHHSASENNLVWSLYFSIENTWKKSYFKSQNLVYHCLRWKSLVKACLFWCIITWALRVETAVKNLYENFQSGLTYSGWQIRFSSFTFLCISKFYTPFPYFFTDLLQEGNQVSSNYLWILERINLSLLSLYFWSCWAKFLILILWKGRGEFYTVKGRPQPHSSFNESKASWTPLFLPQTHSQSG